MKNEILTTTNYSLFKFYNKNRVISEVKVKKLAFAIKTLDLTREKPIVVNEKMEIIDGQHRFAACKSLGLPIYYIRSNIGSKINDAIITLNANQSSWNQLDYIRNYASRGNETYQLILDCMDKYKCSSSIAVAAVTNVSTGNATTVKNGTLKKGKISYHQVIEVWRAFKELFKGAESRDFVRAVVEMVKSGKYDHKKEFKRFELNRYGIVYCGTVEQYLKMFEEILNKHRRGTKIKLI